MRKTSHPYRSFRFPAEIVNRAVWLYHCFSLSLREVELILATKGIVVSYETIREWSPRCGRTYANSLKQRRPRPGNKWLLDEVFVRIRGKLHYLWRDASMRHSAGAATATRNGRAFRSLAEVDCRICDSDWSLET